MDLSTAVNAVVAVFRRRPTDLVPFYVLGSAVPVIARVGAFLGMLVAYLHLLTTGRIETLRDQLAETDLSIPDTDDEAAIEAWGEQLLAVLETVVTPTVALALLVGGVISVLIAIVAYGFVSAGQMHTVFARLRDDRGLTAGIAGSRRHWLTFIGLYLVEILLWVGLLLMTTVVVALALSFDVVVGAIVGIVAFLLVALVLIAVRILFAFAPAAVVVDDTGVGGGLEGAAGFIRSQPAEAAGYAVIAVGVLFAISSIAGTLAFLEAPSIVALVSLFVAAPALDLLKTALYGDFRSAIDPPTSPEVGLREQLGSGLRRSWREMVAFVRETPGLHVVSIGVLAAGFVAGWTAGAPFEGVVTASIEARLAGHIAPAAAVEFFGNNWTVALSMAYAGVAFAVPTLAALAFNGVAFGLFFRLEESIAELAAFVIPHGIFEIPALLVAGAVGIHLGIVAWRTWRGPATRLEFANELERALWVLVGVGILLFVAALIEGFVSPYYYGLFL